MGAGKALLLLVADQELGRINAGQLVQQQVHVLELGYGKLPRGMVHACQAELLLVLIQGHDVIVAGGIQQIHIRQSPRGNDTGQFPFHQLSGLGQCGLLRNGDAASFLHQPPDIAFRAVMGDAAHRNAVALGQCQPQKGGRILGVLKKHLVKIPHAEEQQDVFRQPVLHAKILLHHRGCAGSGLTHK